MPLTVSVALCTYNGERFLPDQLSSILRQVRLPDEIVVSDDGSSDGSIGVVEEFLRAAEERGIATSLLRQTSNGGVTANFAAAIAACSSDLVVLCDQDDVWHTDRLARVIDAYGARPGMLLRQENALLIDESGRRLQFDLYAALGVTPDLLARISGGAAFEQYLRRNLATGATVSFRRSLFERASPIPVEWLHDEWLAIIASALGQVQAVDEALVDYRQHGANVVGVRSPTLRYRVARMFATSTERNAIIARRSAILAARLEAMDGVPEGFVRAARAKAEFEARRAGLPSTRIARMPGILRADRDDGYRRFASQGRLDMIRDLVQRSRPISSVPTARP